MTSIGRAADRAHRSATVLQFMMLACVVIALPASAGASSVDDETCLGCHDGMAATLENTAHAPSALLQASDGMLSCVSCHAGGEVHIEDPSPATIVNPATADAAQLYETCTQCHVAHLELDNLGFDPHAAADVSCVSCHSIHGQEPGLTLAAETDFCAQCHVATAVQFENRSVHPVSDQAIGCLDCHSFNGGAAPDFGHGAAENCVNCHPEQSGPWVWEHEAARSYTPDGAGCVACHAPHGSANDRLLLRDGDMLCNQCHGTPPLHRTAHSGLAMQYGCSDCHTEIHGTNHNQGLLDPNLGSRINGTPASCFCHGAEG